jgi:hypothetical protein
MKILTGLCCIGSVLICITLGYSFYHLVAKRGLGHRGGSEDSNTVPAGFTGSVQTDDGAFRMVENINFPSSGYSLFSILACLVAVAAGGFLLWVLYRKYLDWRANNDTPPDMPDLEDCSPPPSYSRAERDRESHQRSRPRHHRRHRRGRQANQAPDEAPCPHPWHQEDDQDDQAEEWVRMQMRRSERGSRAASPMSISPRQQQLPLAPRPRDSDTEARMLWQRYFDQGHIHTHPRPIQMLHGGGTQITREQLC